MLLTMLFTMLLTTARLHVLLELSKVMGALCLLHGGEEVAQPAGEGLARHGDAHDSALSLFVVQVEHQLAQLGLAHLVW